MTIIDSLSGFMALSLTEYNTSAAAAIAAGSKVEIAGAFFTFAGDEAIEASTWTSIVTGNTAYIALTAAGSAGSQTVTATYTQTAPTWRDDLQGWYASAASNVRVIGSVYKAEATRYYPKYIYNPKVPDSYRQSGKQIFTSSGVFHVPLTVNQVYLTGCAAGGNGASGQSGSPARGGGGGGGGEVVYKKPFSVTPGSSIIITIGAVGSNTFFGAIAFNYGSNGVSGGAGGAGGALGSGSVAGARGASGASSGTTAQGKKNGFAWGGYCGESSNGGGGGAGGLGNFASWFNSTSGGTALHAGGLFGEFSGGGGGGGYGNPTGAIGGVGGYGCGGGGGGGGYTTGGAGGAGGPGIIIVEW